jgi:hypothetical protein
MTYILGTLPNWIQALAAVFLVGLTGWTLKVLRGYAEDTNSLARDTASLARDSASQLDSAQMPFLAVASKPPEPGGRTGGFVIENQGLGPALNVVCTFFDSANVPRSIPSRGTDSKHVSY